LHKKKLLRILMNGLKHCRNVLEKELRIERQHGHRRPQTKSWRYRRFQIGIRKCIQYSTLIINSHFDIQWSLHHHSMPNATQRCKDAPSNICINIITIIQFTTLLSLPCLHQHLHQTTLHIK
jgi:hypothetical protein